MTKPIIYHNPRCSKSRETLQLLEKRGLSPKIIEYLNTPPTVTEIEAILKKLKLTPRELLRKKEPEYKALGLDNTSLQDDKIIRIIAKHPKLIERPIVIYKNKAAIGRPPERVLDIL